MIFRSHHHEGLKYAMWFRLPSLLPSWCFLVHLHPSSNQPALDERASSRETSESDSYSCIFSIMNICCALLSLFNSLSSCDHSAHVNVVQVKTGTSPSNSISLYSLDEASFVSVCVCMFKHGLSFIIDQRVSCWKTRKLESWTSVCRTVDVVPGRCVHLCDTRGARTLDPHQYVTLLKVL